MSDNDSHAEVIPRGHAIRFAVSMMADQSDWPLRLACQSGDGTQARMGCVERYPTQMLLAPLLRDRQQVHLRPWSRTYQDGHNVVTQHPTPFTWLVEDDRTV